MPSIDPKKARDSGGDWTAGASSALNCLSHPARKPPIRRTAIMRGEWIGWTHTEASKRVVSVFFLSSKENATHCRLSFSPRIFFYTQCPFTPLQRDASRLHSRYFTSSVGPQKQHQHECMNVCIYMVVGRNGAERWSKFLEPPRLTGKPWLPSEFASITCGRPEHAILNPLECPTVWSHGNKKSFRRR